MRSQEKTMFDAIPPSARS